MKYSEATHGRVFVVRLEDGDILHEQIEKLAAEKQITAAAVICVGGADAGSKIVVGPEQGRAKVIHPMQYMLDNVHEITGTGTIFPNKDGKPVLHMHIACGRNDLTHTGCVRTGVKVWHILEVIVLEFIGSTAKRLKDEITGFELMVP